MADGHGHLPSVLERHQGLGRSVAAWRTTL